MSVLRVTTSFRADAKLGMNRVVHEVVAADEGNGAVARRQVCGAQHPCLCVFDAGDLNDAQGPVVRTQLLRRDQRVQAFAADLGKVRLAVFDPPDHQAREKRLEAGLHVKNDEFCAAGLRVKRTGDFHESFRVYG